MPTPARTSLEAIISSARDIIEADGIDALTMQRIAGAVGVRAPSLYKRVRSRDDLLRLIVDDVARELTDQLDAATATGDAERDLRALATAIRSFAHGQPAAYGLLFAQGPAASQPDPEVLARAVQPLMRTTVTLAGSDRSLEAARTVVAWAHGFISMELAGAFRLGGDVDRAYAFGIDTLTVALARTR